MSQMFPSIVRTAGQAMAGAFRAVYAKDLAVRETQATAFWLFFLIVWTPLLYFSEPIFETLLRSGFGTLPAMLVSFAAYLLPVRWLAGLAADRLQRRRVERLSKGRIGTFDSPMTLSAIGAVVAAISGLIFSYLWLEWTIMALVACGVYLAGGLPFRPWRTPLRQAVSSGLFVGIALSSLTVGLWVLGR